MNLNEQLADLLIETGKAHHEAFIETDGEDPEWPSWYARYLQPKLKTLLSQELTESEIVFWLIGADRSHANEKSEAPWAVYFSKHILDQLHVE